MRNSEPFPTTIRLETIVINRGDVFKTSIQLPNRTAGSRFVAHTKFLIALQGGTDFDRATDIAVVVASTHRRDHVRPFEVLVDQAHGFDHDTVLDCRWIYTLPKSMLPPQAEFQLSRATMQEVSVALVVGLQMN